MNPDSTAGNPIQITYDALRRCRDRADDDDPAGCTRPRIIQTQPSVPVRHFFTADRRRAVLLGSLLYLGGGGGFGVLYFILFASLGRSGWWLGALIGAAHGLFLLVSLQAMVQLHPRVASEYDAPTAEPKLKPPGFMGLLYGSRTPLTTLPGHAVYGTVLGAFLPMR